MNNRTALSSGTARPRSKSFRCALTLFLAAGLSLAAAKATSIAPDPIFHPPTFTKATPPQRALLLPDGKYFLFLDPDTLTDRSAGPLTRFLANGSLDTSFNFTRNYQTVTAVAPAGNGQFYVAATRYAYRTKDAEQILRVNADGSIDATFSAVTVGGADAFTDVRRIIVQPDGKVLVAGFFYSFGGDTSRHGVVRLSTNGALDTGFAGITLNNEVYGLALQNDGKVLISGSFTTVNGVARTAIARLEGDGTLDASFQPSGFSRTGPIRGIALQPDGSIVISGNLRIGSSSLRAPVIRLNSNGVCDTTFDSTGNWPSNVIGRDLALQSDGKVVVAVNNSVYRFKYQRLE